MKAGLKKFFFRRKKKDAGKAAAPVASEAPTEKAPATTPDPKAGMTLLSTNPFSCLVRSHFGLRTNSFIALENLKASEVKPDVTSAAPVAAPEAAAAKPASEAAKPDSKAAEPDSEAAKPDSAEPVVKPEEPAVAQTIPTESELPATEPVEQAPKAGK